MRTQSRPFRLTATAAVAALLLAQVLPRPVLAQGVPPPSQPAAPDQQGGDPPARVGRLAQINGMVSFHAADDNQWSPATLNYPVSQGYAFWTQPDAQAAIEVSASRLVMAPATELDIATLTDTALQVTQPQGELYLRLGVAAPDETYAVQTPRGLVTLAVPGRYGIVAGDTQGPTLVTVIDGSAHIEGPGVSLDVRPDQTASITGSDPFQGEVGPAQPDAFLTAMLDAERPQQVATPAVVRGMPGADQLAQYGAWSESTEYGQVWYPQVSPDWVPYREGSWAYVAPWGWTWMDSDPWGFAPFHYGRWLLIGGRWGWIPGVVAGPPVPVYAPALVTFLGVGAVVGIGIGAALAEGRIGWCPLGPREPFHPWFHASDRYFRQVNITHVTNFNTINRTIMVNNFVNRGAATVVPAGVMAASRPVSGSFQRMDPAQVAQARPLIGQQPLRPTPTTVGVTPAVARQLNLPPPTLHTVAPGPAIRATPAAIGAGAVAGRQALPALHNPGETALPVAAGARPFTTVPALRNPPAPGQISPPAIQHRPGSVGQGATSHLPPPGIQGNAPAPGAITHSGPLTATPPSVAVHNPPPVVNHPPPPVVYRGNPTTPASITHAAPVATPPPPVVNHVPPPVVNRAPPPPVAQFHPQPPPVVHNAPQLVHAAPNPAPQFHPPPPPPQASHAPPPQNNQHKRPGEQ